MRKFLLCKLKTVHRYKYEREKKVDGPVGVLLSRAVLSRWPHYTYTERTRTNEYIHSHQQGLFPHSAYTRHALGHIAMADESATRCMVDFDGAKSALRGALPFVTCPRLLIVLFTTIGSNWIVGTFSTL